MRISRVHLPIDDLKQAILDAVHNAHPAVIVVGATGSGKTTQLPQFLLDAGLAGKSGVIGVSQPRRVAAVSVARRVAEERNSKLGKEIGYTVRFDDCTSPDTRIKYMTDGILLREALHDITLSKYRIIVMDEAHERSTQTDMLFGLIKKFHLSSHLKKNSPKIVVMSATLEENKFSAFFKCHILSIPGRLYPVEDVYCNLLTEKDFQSPEQSNFHIKAVDVVMTIHETQPRGDILMFLTGQNEIEKVCDLLFKKSELLDYKYDVSDKTVNGMIILPLYGALPGQRQQDVFNAPPNGVRKIIVATNIAATSLTIDGIRYVIDSGFVKQSEYNPRLGLQALKVVPISVSEAVQRKGRAGRTIGGKCFRLYSEVIFTGILPPVTVPEIQRMNLTTVLLYIKCCGVDDVIGFKLIDTPTRLSLLEAMRELIILGALSPRTGIVTETGKRMADFPISPEMSVIVLNSLRLGSVYEILIIIALLTVENLFLRARPDDAEEVTSLWEELKTKASGINIVCDYTFLLIIYEAWVRSGCSSKWARKYHVRHRSLLTAKNVRAQLQGILEKQGLMCETVRTQSDVEHGLLNSEDCVRIRRALAAGLFGCTARRVVGQLSFVTKEGHGNVVHVHPGSVLFGQESRLDWIVYGYVQTTSRAYMINICPIEASWVENLIPRLHEIDVYKLDDCGRLIENKSSNESPSDTAVVDVSTFCEDTTQLSRQSMKRPTSTRRNDDDKIASAREKFLQRKMRKATQ
eukprot:CFRG7349T1